MMSQKEDNDITKTEDLEKIINLIMSSKLHRYDKDKFFRMKFPNFAKTMPMLFDKLVNDNLSRAEIDQMYKMLDMRKKMLEKREIEVIDADKIIYGDLRKKYVDPKIQFDKSKLEEYMNKKEYTEEELNGTSDQFKLNVRDT